MKKCLALFGLVAIPVALSGCSTLTESGAERCHNVRQVENYNVLMFNEDVDHFWLVDSPSRLSRWMIR